MVQVNHNSLDQLGYVTLKMLTSLTWICVTEDGCKLGNWKAEKLFDVKSGM